VGNLDLAGGADRYLLACAGVLVDYWTQWTGDYNMLFQVGWIMTVPGLLLTMVGSTVLGTTLLVRLPDLRLRTSRPPRPPAR
jgi:hypothetical protein